MNFGHNAATDDDVVTFLIGSHCEQAADTAAEYDDKAHVDSSVEIESMEPHHDLIHDDNHDDDDDDDDDEVPEQHSAVVVSCPVT